MTHEPVVALDLGTTTMRVLVAEEGPDDLWRVTGVGKAQSRGMRKGDCSHLEDASEAARAALAAAEQDANMAIQSVMLPLSGTGIHSRSSSFELAVKDTVTEDHLSQILSEARQSGLPPNCRLLHNVVQRYRLDQAPGVNPVGLNGNVLALDSLLVYGEHRSLMNLVRVAKNLNLDVTEPCFSGLCAATACLDAFQKQQGVAFIDLGGGVTTYVVYAEGMMADAGVLPVGGSNVTNDIATAFRLTFSSAETLKIQHGDAMIDHTLRNRRVEAIPSRQSIKIPDLQTVIHFRMDETLGLVREILEKKELTHLLGAGVVLSGGGARLKNVATLAERVFNLPCSVAVPRNFPELRPGLAGPEWATALGALGLGVQNQLSKTPLHRSWLKRARSFFGFD